MSPYKFTVFNLIVRVMERPNAEYWMGMMTEGIAAIEILEAHGFPRATVKRGTLSQNKILENLLKHMIS